MIKTKEYLSFILTPTFRWWWLIITGIASISAWLGLPEEGLSLSKQAFIIFMIVESMLIFMLISVIFNSLVLFRESKKILIHDYHMSTDYDDKKIIFILKSPIVLDNDMLLSLIRNCNGVEVCISLLHVEGKREDGIFQAKEIWMAPAHIRELNSKSISRNDLFVRRNLTFGEIKRFIDSYYISKELR